MRRLLLITSVALAALGLAACGGSKTESADTTAAPTTSADAGGGGSTSGGSSGSEFCVEVGKIFSRYGDSLQGMAASPQLDPSNPQAALQQMQEYGRKLLAPMQEIQQVAPPEVKSDVDALVAGFQALASGDPQALATAGQQMQTSGQNFAQYMATNCPNSDISGFGGGAGTGTATGPG